MGTGLTLIGDVLMDEENNYKNMMSTPIKGNIHNKHSAFSLTPVDIIQLEDNGITKLGHLYLKDLEETNPNIRNINNPYKNNQWTQLLNTRIDYLQASTTTAFIKKKNGH